MRGGGWAGEGQCRSGCAAFSSNNLQMPLLIGGPEVQKVDLLFFVRETIIGLKLNDDISSFFLSGKTTNAIDFSWLTLW